MSAKHETLPARPAVHVTVTTPQLGPVGGRIVAEAFLGLMFNDRLYLLTLTPKWSPPQARIAA